METDDKNQIYVSAIASKKIKEQLEKRNTPKASIRLGIKGSGCSGFSYHFQFEDSPPKDKDIIFNIDEVRIIVDNKSILYLHGCTLDWENTLIYQGFKFRNPNEKSKCGCGLSFSL